MSDQPRRHRGTRLGFAPRVAPAWSEYRDQRGNLENPVIAREVHYDVLRREGFDADRARQIAAESSEKQHRLAEEMRGERRGPALERQAERLRSSGFKLSTLLPDAFLTDEERAQRASDIAEREAALAAPADPPTEG